MTCPICLEEVETLVTCWNEHELCEPCYKSQMRPRRGGEFNVPINTNCPECREPMFDWFGLEDARVQVTHPIALARQRGLQRTQTYADENCGGDVEAFKEMIQNAKNRCIKDYKDERKRILRLMERTIRRACPSRERGIRLAAMRTLQDKWREHRDEWDRLKERFGDYRFDFALPHGHTENQFVAITERGNPLTNHRRACGCCGIPGHTRPICGHPGNRIGDLMKQVGLEGPYDDV